MVYSSSLSIRLFIFSMVVFGIFMIASPPLSWISSPPPLAIPLTSSLIVGLFGVGTITILSPWDIIVFVLEPIYSIIEYISMPISFSAAPIISPSTLILSMDPSLFTRSRGI